MNSSPEPGLCGACVHQRRIDTGRSVFSLCARAAMEPKSFPKYPRLPVLRCAGFARSG